LDYYRMAYGGSYEPYRGFLYGTPAVYAPVYSPGYPNPPYEIYGPSFPAPAMNTPVPPPPAMSNGW
jgi:hypothetical protein